MLASQLSLGKERRPTTSEVRGAVRVMVDLDDSGDRAFQKTPIVTHQQYGPRKSENPTLEALEPIHVEVVGRLIEQEHIESCKQQRCKCAPGGLTTRQRSC